MSNYQVSVFHQNKKSCKYSTKFYFSVGYEYNALFSFVFSKLYKQKLCVFWQGRIVLFLVALLHI